MLLITGWDTNLLVLGSHDGPFFSGPKSLYECAAADAARDRGSRTVAGYSFRYDGKVVAFPWMLDNLLKSMDFRGMGGAVRSAWSGLAG